MKTHAIKLFLCSLLLFTAAGQVAYAAEPITGYWDFTMTFGENQFDSKLHITADDEGALNGIWTSRRGTAEVTDLKFTDGKLSFSVRDKRGDNEWSATYQGVVSGKMFRGKLKSAMGEIPANGVRGTKTSKPKRVYIPPGSIVKPVRTEIISPIRNETFNKNGTSRERRQGGNPRQVSGYLVFDGSMDGDRQVDPQIAVGGGYVLHGSNGGLIIYDKEGNFVQGVPQNSFNGGIDPKLFFDPHNQVFGFDLWKYWDKEKIKPVNISISETSDPTGAWNTYPVPAPGGRDGGAIGYSKKWIGYSFPGGPEQTFIMKMAEAKAGKNATVYHFPGSLGAPVMSQDGVDDLYFFRFSDSRFTLRKVTEDDDGTPKSILVSTAEHGLEYVGRPPQSPQKGTEQKTSSGDRNPKNIILQNECIWFSQTINCDGRAAVQWHQIKLDGSIVQTGLISDSTNSYIQTTIAVNKNEDVLVGFQETGDDMFISPRMAFRKSTDAKGTTREIIKLGEGKGATNGTSWGDYSGSTVDADNMLDLWTIQSITDEKGKGDTLIAKVPMPDK